MGKLSLLCSLLFLLPLLASCERQVYVVYFGEHSGEKTHQEIEDTHHSYLLSVKNTEEEARASILYSYKNSINGFAALLTPDEASRISEMDGVIDAFPSLPNKWSLQTTRSWKFLGLQEGEGDGKMHNARDSFLNEAKYGKDIVVGLLDSGIWPESRSFADEGMGPVPKSWKGICEAGDSFNSSHCNRKIIGARYYIKGFEHYYNTTPNYKIDFRSPRDHDGHGSHTSSTVGGRAVHNVSALGGYARGTASGGAPLVRLAMYKVCWPVPGQTLATGDTCLGADMLAAIDDAIGDGVDILSISIVSTEPQPYLSDGIALGALHAVKKKIVVAGSAGNSGPNSSTTSNNAPWIITVGASTLDREFSSPVVLGNGMIIKGESASPHKLENKMYPLVYAGDVVEPHVPKNSTAGQCLPGSLSPEKTKGKIVLCIRGEGSRVGKGLEVKRAGGAAIILGNSPMNGNDLSIDPYVLPGTAVVANETTKIYNYIKSTDKPMAEISPGMTVIHSTTPAPTMAAFSSTGPNALEPNIIKPDITAPGVNILAAWSEASSPTKLDFDHRHVKYNFDSGTSMSCPHVAAIAALVKAIHPTWSSAAIRSAIMTTASRKNNLGKPITTASGELATPFNYGSGHIHARKASDPGLVYDAAYTDYLLFLCSSGIDNFDPAFKCPKVSPSPSNLNYPSLAIAKLNGTTTVKRTVKNVGGCNSTYFATIKPPQGFSVKIHPSVLHFSHVGQMKTFTVTVKAKEGKRKTGEDYSFGLYTWKDGVHEVRSPIAVSHA